MRSIPALAGERRSIATRFPMNWVYPRACGGTFDFESWFRFEAGLSPRLRGNENRDHPQTPAWGSIPALAGERANHPLSLSPAWVYPRACGGTHLDPEFGGECVGLSPRLRGNVWKWQRLHSG